VAWLGSRLPDDPLALIDRLRGALANEASEPNPPTGEMVVS
jgi:hypothetical protein